MSALLGLGLALAACHDPAREAAARDARDHDRLAALVASDETLDRALKAADDASRAGDDARGAELLETTATRAAADAFDKTKAATFETAWAGARRDALLTVLEERRASIPTYAQAMRGEDLGAKLLTLTLQIDLQKRALAVAEAALAPPGAQASPPLPGDAG